MDCHPRSKHNPLKSSPELFHIAPQIAFSLTMCKFLHHLSHYCIALSLIFPADILSPTFSKFRSSLQQMESMPRLVKNYFSHKNQEAHLDKALAFMKTANLHCPSKTFTSNYLPWYILLGIMDIPNFINQSG
jgi:hypothetical protein